MKELFSEEEWSLLENSILWMFHSIAYADRVIEPEEINAMKRLKSMSDKFDSKLIQEILNSLELSDEDYHNTYNYKARARIGLNEIARLIDNKLTDEEALLFKKSLLASAIYIAKSSGLDESKYISFEEMRAIKELSHLIDISPIDLTKSPTLDEIINRLDKE